MCMETHTRTTADRNRHTKEEELMLSTRILKCLRSDMD